MTDPTPVGLDPVQVEREAVRKVRGLGRWRFLLQRLGFYLLTFWVALTINFVIPRFMPGDPAAATIRRLEQATGGPVAPETRQAIAKMFGDPSENLVQQYFAYLGNLLHGDLGTSIVRYPMPVSELLLEALPWSLALIGISTMLAWVLGMSGGIVLGWRQGSRLDTWLTPASTVLAVIPDFWIAIILLYLFAFIVPMFPAAGSYDPDVPYSFSLEFFVHAVPYSVLPLATLVIATFAAWIFQMRNMMVTTLGEDYVLLARAKGLRDSRVMFRYAARNALLPSVTTLALSAPRLITGAVFVESVFSYPGMGYYFTQSVAQRDFATMQAIFLLTIVVTLVANFLVDSVYAIVDPRARR